MAERTLTPRITPQAQRCYVENTASAMKQRAVFFCLSFAFASTLAACSGNAVTNVPIAPIASIEPIAPNVATPSVVLPGGATALSLAGVVGAQFSVSESGYTGTFIASSSNTAVATVSPASVQSAGVRVRPAAAGGSATFTVTPVGNGTASISVSDSSGKTSIVPVIVTTGTGTIN
jgi:hypothetical protein